MVHFQLSLMHGLIPLIFHLGNISDLERGSGEVPRRHWEGGGGGLCQAGGEGRGAEEEDGLTAHLTRTHRGL